MKNYMLNIIYLCLFFFKYKIIKKKYCVFQKDSNTKWAYISYLVEPIYRKYDKKYMLRHQNRRESLIIYKILLASGYNLVIEDFSSSDSRTRKRRYEMVFGLEPNFVNLAQLNPTALKIYYATGSYWKFQNEQIVKRTTEFNVEKRVKVPFERMVFSHNSCEIADSIFQIGTEITKQSYPLYLKEKICLLNQSCNNISLVSPQDKLNAYNKKHYIWFGGGGSILKGLDLVLDFFSERNDLFLHVVGNIDSNMLVAYREIYEMKNIYFHGFLDVTSHDFYELMNIVTFNIFPSCSEGGCPGSVITCMQNGVIPIVSSYASFETILDYGYCLDDLSVKAISEAIIWSQCLSDADLKQLIINNIHYSRMRWSLSSFNKDFYKALKFVVK